MKNIIIIGKLFKIKKGWFEAEMDVEFRRMNNPTH